MDSEADSSGDIANISLGREIMQAVKQNDLERPPHTQQERHRQNRQHYQFDSSATGSDVSGNVLGEMDDYLDEALDDEEEEETTPVSIFSCS